MNNELIKIEEQKIGDREVNSVDARELWEFLESKQQFSDWIKSRIEKYRFEEGTDFCSFHKIMKREIGASTQKEYWLTLDMAKELAMVENNEKGKQIRKYFIEVEKKYKQVVQEEKKDFTPLDYAQKMLEISQKLVEAEKDKIHLLLENKKKDKFIERQEQRIESERPKVEFFDSAMNSTTLIDMERVAKILAVKGLGRNKLFAFLRRYKVLNQSNVPYQQYVDAGHFKLIEKMFKLKNGKHKVVIQTMVYQKGLDYIRKLIQDKYSDFKLKF